ncbi:TPA: hypothetical protein PMB19_001245 [Vibrio cholerae]|nr:hypothetical protein [Vibrio cholerae]
MLKKTLLAACSVVIIGCGGGSDGSSVTLESTDGQVSCGNMPEMACTYPLKKLRSNILFSHDPAGFGIEESYTVYVDMYGQDKLGNSSEIKLPYDHRFELLVDGMSYPLKQGPHQIIFLATDVPVDGQNYEISWFKGDVLVESNAIQSLAKSVEVAIDLNASNEMQLWVLNWQTDYTYEVNHLSVDCIDQNNTRVRYDAIGNTEALLETNQMTLSLSENYGLDYSRLVNDFKTCELGIMVRAHKKIEPRDPINKMSIKSYTELFIGQKLF